MAINDRKLNNFSFKHKDQPDRPNMTTNQFKSALDSQGEELQEKLNGLIDELDWEFDKRGVNVRKYGARGDGITNDTVAIQTAIDTVYNAGGGLVFIPTGTYMISSPLLWNKKNVSLIGTGHGSIIKASVNMDAMIKYTGTSGYGNRGAAIRDILIDGNNLATTGVLIGYSIGTVVGEEFHNIRIQNTTGYGMVWDACQNNYFSLIDIENCSGGLSMLNGAGNNVVMKSEFTMALTSYVLFGGSDSTYPGYNNNDFANVPQANKFYGCIFERGSVASAILISAGRHNQFNDCEFASQNMTVAAVQLQAGALLTHFKDCRFAGLGTTKPAIINDGYYTYVEGCYFEGYPTIEMLTSNKIVLGDNGSDRLTKIAHVQNTAGDAALNIAFSSAPRYLASTTTPTEPKVSEFFHDINNQIFFQGKTNYEQFITGANLTIKDQATPSDISHTATATLPYAGMWMVEITVRNGDWNHSRSAMFMVRFHGGSVNNLVDVQKIGTDAVSGSLITSLSASITVAGLLSVTGASSSATTGAINIRAVCTLKY